MDDGGDVLRDGGGALEYLQQHPVAVVQVVVVVQIPRYSALGLHWLQVRW